MIRRTLSVLNNELGRVMASDKFDIKKAHKAFYSAKRDFQLVDVPELRYLTVDGRGNPNISPEYTAALETLYGVAYAVKFDSKNSLDRDFVVGPLEGLWRAEDPTTFTRGDKGSWEWTMMISQPDWITDDMVSAGSEKAASKKDACDRQAGVSSPYGGTVSSDPSYRLI